MRFEWNEDKAASNLAKHRVAFEDIVRFEIATATVAIDDRRDYGETRFVAIGLLGDGVAVAVYTEREEGVVRVISLRPANRKEIMAYVEEL